MPSRSKALIAALAAALLAGLLAINFAAYRCADAGRWFDVIAFRCRVVPRIEIERDLKRAHLLKGPTTRIAGPLAL